jgi:hypothetical protein
MSDLEHRVPLARIRSARMSSFGEKMFSIEFLKKRFGKSRLVDLEFLGSDGREVKLWLCLKRPEAFLEAIGKPPGPHLIDLVGRVESL